MSLRPSKRAITHFFRSRRPVALTLAGLRSIYTSNRKDWRLSDNVTFDIFHRQIIEDGLVHRLVLDALPYRSTVRYLCGSPSLCDTALTLRPQSYLSHGTALYLHGLTDIKPPAEPTQIILNQEQSPKPEPDGELTQAALDRAFAAAQRLSNYRFRSGNAEILLTNGKATGCLGVIQMPGPRGVMVRATDLERTLVDCVVRPAYAGGVNSVLAAMCLATARVSLTKLVHTLHRLEYRYPYHQSLGFLLERAGFSRPQLESLRELGTDFEFHLQHGMARSQTRYDTYWRLHYPADLETAFFPSEGSHAG